MVLKILRKRNPIYIIALQLIQSNCDVTNNGSHLTLLIMISFYLKWTFTEYKELLSIGLDRIWQRCLVNGSLSRICSLKCGVPQGTILGPLLFLIYINDLPNCLTSCQPRMYADDTHTTYADVDVNSIQLNLKHDLGNLNKWLISNKLTLNTAKTEFMLIGSRQKLSTLSSQPELSIDNVSIENVTSVKSFGIFIDENLRSQTRIDKLSKNIASGIGTIKIN